MPRDQRLYMTFPIDFPDHPKVKPLNPTAKWTFVEMNAYSRRLGLDGRIPAATARAIWPKKPLADLVASHPERPLVLLDGETYVIRDYADHQQTTGDIEDLRQKRALAGAKGGKAKAEAQQQGSKPLASAKAKDEQTEAELRDRDKDASNEASSKAPSARGTRVPADFKVDAEMREWAKTETPLVNVDEKLPEFIDYWASVPGQRGVKLDWVATWRNGMRKQQEFAERAIATSKKPVDSDAWMNAS